MHQNHKTTFGRLALCAALRPGVHVKYLLLYFEENYGLTVEKKIIDAVAVIANENRYHPVCDFLNALQWDGTERIRFCLHRFLGSDTDDYTYEALKLFLLGAISRAFKPGCKFEVMLCLVGGQGTMSFLGIRGFAILRLLTTGISWLILERLPEEIDKNCQTQKGFCMAAVIFVVMVTVIEFSWLGRMASGGENAFIYFRF